MSGTNSTNGTGNGVSRRAITRMGRTSGVVKALQDAGADRRRHRRVPWQHHDLAPLTLEVESVQGAWREVPCTLVDLAAGGVGILVAEPLDAGARVRVTFPLPSRLGRDAAESEGEQVEVVSLSALAEVVHGRHVPEPSHDHVPADAHLPHHRGVRFAGLEQDAEMRLLRALYGPMPAGWAIEQYAAPHRRSGRPAETGGAETAVEPRPVETRYAVVRDGKRVAWGFSTYDRARTRALSMHMDDVAVHTRQRTQRTQHTSATESRST